MNINIIFNNITKNIKAHKDILNDLDQVIGDGDHGTNLVRGFEAIIDQLPNLILQKTNVALKSAAITLMSKVGGSSGPLLGSLLLGISSKVKKETLINFIEGFSAGLESIKMLGQAKLGDKTIVDALEPALKSMQKDLNKPIQIIFKNAVLAAKKGADETINIIAKKGRASYLGERSIGYMDPGAYSIYLIFKAISEVL